MKIGEFAKACKTRISVLRHYDELGLLRPCYVDRFTEYRYYDESQIAVFTQIQSLKAAGFSLSEIKLLLYSWDEEAVLQIFDKKRWKLEQTLHNLEALRLTMSGGNLMNNSFKPLIEDVNLPFENDEQAIGKWQVLGECENGDWRTGIGGTKKVVYFLPNGQRYWCYSWTKGKFIFRNGSQTFANDYRIEQRGDDLYMIINFKSYDYLKDGKTTPIALRKLDSKHYTLDDIRRKDNINKQFVNDERVLESWKSVDLVRRIEDFSPDCIRSGGVLFFEGIEFLENGSCKTVSGGRVTCDDAVNVWTKGYFINKPTSTASAYKLAQLAGKEYLFIEWKSGDYTFGGMDPGFYVFEREGEQRPLSDDTNIGSYVLESYSE